MSEIIWQKSSYSSEGNACVELAAAEGAILLRESDEPDVTAKTDVRPLKGLIQAIKAGERGPRNR